MKRLLMIALVIMGLGAGVIALSSPDLAFAAPKDEVCEGIPGGCSSGSDDLINSTVKNVVGILSAIVGIVSVIVLIIAGFRYVTSAGDSAKITSAKNTIIYAVVGLIVVALAQFIVQFVLDKST